VVGAYPRTVTDSLGRSITFAQRPERVALDTNRYAFDELLLLGVVPIAYQISASEALAPWTRAALAELGASPENYNGLPYPNPPNLERLSVLGPDLIIMLSYGPTRAEEYELFSLYEQIAPVFFVEYTDLDASRLRMLAEVFAVEEQVAAIEARDAELFQQVTPPPTRVELAVGFGYRDGGVASQVYNGGGRSELIVLERAGFTIKDFGRPAGERDFNVAEENLTLLDTDMLWNVAPYPGDRSAQDFESSPIVQNLAVVKDGRYRSLNADQSQAILFWTPLATPFLVETLNELVASYNFEGSAAPTSAAYPRTITDGAGQQVMLAAPPQRIAVLDPLASLEALLSLGVAPVQIGQRSFVAEYTGDPLLQWPWLEAALTQLGADPERIIADQTNVEAVAAAQPDLIIGQPSWVDEQRELLNGIAPTFTTSQANVRESIILLSEALAIEDKAARVLADWDARLASEVEGLVTSEATVAIIRTDSAETFAVFNVADYGPYDMMTRAGFRLPDALANAEKNYFGLGSEFSRERLDVLSDADVIVVLGFSPEITDEFLASPLFQALPAAQAGRVTRIEQGPVAQAFAALSPLNLDTVLPVIREAAALAP
jgi:ABC-type Fe3+-hydroxamate transport system substrate-binding protein